MAVLQTCCKDRFQHEERPEHGGLCREQMQGYQSCFDSMKREEEKEAEEHEWQRLEQEKKKKPRSLAPTQLIDPSDDALSTISAASSSRKSASNKINPFAVELEQQRGASALVDSKR